MTDDDGPRVLGGVLVAGGFTAIPRWTLDPGRASPSMRRRPRRPRRGVRRLADELDVPLSSVLLAAHAKVLAALSGEREVATGYVGATGVGPLPCRLATEAESWRELLLDTHRVEAQLLAHADFPVDELQARARRDGTGVRDRLRPDRRGRRPRRGHRAAGGDRAATATSLRCDCGIGPTCWTRTAPPGSPAITSPRWR